MKNQEDNPLTPAGCLTIAAVLLLIGVAFHIASGILTGIGRALNAIPWYVMILIVAAGLWIYAKRSQS